MSRKNGDGGKPEMSSFVCIAKQISFLSSFTQKSQKCEGRLFADSLRGDSEQSKGSGTYSMCNYQHIDNKLKVILNNKLSTTAPMWKKTQLNGNS